MNIKLRPATSQDSPEILATKVAAIRELCAGDYTPVQIQAWTAAVEEDRGKAGDSEFLVAVGDGGVVGFGELAGGGDEVLGIYVHPRHARLGLGTMLFQALEKRARTAGKREWSLTSTLTAVPFYQRLGFVPGPTAVVQVADGAEIPAVTMQRGF